MPACEIDVDASPTFQKLVRSLRKKYRHLEQDLADAFKEIEKDYETRAYSRPIPRYDRRIWKHRWKSTDLQAGASGGIRIISARIINGDRHILYPLLVYYKVNKVDVTAEELAEALKELHRILDTHPETEDEAEREH